MTARPDFLCAIILAAVLAGAGAGQEPRFGSYDSQPADARIRYNAKEIMGDLEQPSCAWLGVPAGFDRAKALAPEIQAVEQFKDRIRGSAGFFYFEVGQQDARYEQKQQSKCWNDSKDWLAEVHINDAKKSTKARLEALEKLVVEVRRPPSLLSAEPAIAEFRYRVRQLVESSRPRCRLTQKAENEALSASARASVARFRRDLDGTIYALHFDMAEGDVNLLRAMTEVECDDEGSKSAKYWTSRILSNVNKQIQAIRKLAHLEPGPAIFAKP